jgi:anti-sigma factor RsiW
MSPRHFVRGFAAAVFCLFPAAAWAGSLSGKVASSANVAQPNVVIEAVQNSSVVASATTDASGN